MKRDIDEIKEKLRLTPMQFISYNEDLDVVSVFCGARSSITGAELFSESLGSENLKAEDLNTEEVKVEDLKAEDLNTEEVKQKRAPNKKKVAPKKNNAPKGE